METTNESETEYHFLDIDSDTHTSDDSDLEWEDVPLDQLIINLKPNNNIGTIPRSKDKKRLDTLVFKKLCLNLSFGLHICEIPFLLINFQKKFISYTIYNTRLHKVMYKKILPKLISTKFSNWNKIISLTTKKNKIRTLLLGLVYWFRNNFKINSNGVRQNPYRLKKMVYSQVYSKINDKNNKKVGSQNFNSHSFNVKQYYGDNADWNCIRERNIVDLVKKKLGSRDELVFFFYILLLKLIDFRNNKDMELRLVYSLPVHDWMEFENKLSPVFNNKHDYRVPNKCDSDLLSPYYWIELKLDNREIYVIDPVVSLSDGNKNGSRLVAKYLLDEYVSQFESFTRLNPIQKHYYVLGINQNFEVYDLSPRYLQNITYRYLPSLFKLNKNRHWRSYCIWKKYLKKISWFYIEDDTESEMLKKLALKNYSVPQTLVELKYSPNFTSDLFYQKSVKYGFKKGSKPLVPKSGDFQNKISIYWKKDLVELKSLQTWLLQGRSVKASEIDSPIKTKTYYKNIREKTAYAYKKRKLTCAVTTSHNTDQQLKIDLRKLYSFGQTIPTPKLPTLPNIKDYENIYGDVEIYDIKQVKPDGYEIVPKIILRGNNSLNVISVIKRHNNRTSGVSDGTSSRIKYIEVVSGFDFRQTPGFASPIKAHIMLDKESYWILNQLVKEQQEIDELNDWFWLIKLLDVKNKISLIADGV
ncbi:uncharacterized protein SCODWIG_03002 [Saccharomycodes ludwigii]|uniref:Uncharacterized protein n=1 Tax=Saccharomycodes ludwigii TaxID=36035 RepID=A0A376B9E4_9ASCO|nr:hypothetical protein SCDLUD_004651 [Saccharomycodes ludwigii]KAH3899219.1 hypothetical protein SCDLUD_004651 [Saccharomycodes ludwigii]SSD61241.1 uncharacterized protein SCODWIG_03002 [Saccharomycodes ludwigii]